MSSEALPEFDDLWSKLDNLFHPDQDPLVTRLNRINRETVIEKRAMRVRSERVKEDMRVASVADAITQLDWALEQARD